MIVFGKTDRGMVRSCNQDDYACGIFDDGTVWAIVCDGMGGAAAGDVASKCAVKIISSYIAEHYNSDMPKDEIEEMLTVSATLANSELQNMVKANFSLLGMGTTLVAAIVKNDVAYVAHAGDSRAYIIENDVARQITKDHSVVQELVDIGKLTPEQASVHPRRNVITRALGVDPKIKIDFGVHQLGAESKLLLCTDGLTGCVNDDMIGKIFGEYAIEELPERYIREANANGGNDNITAVVVCK